MNTSSGVTKREDERPMASSLIPDRLIPSIHD
jgi:hypothetical protein